MRCCLFQTPSVDHRESATALVRFTRRSWQKFFAGKNLVTAQTQLRLYSELELATSAIALGSLWIPPLTTNGRTRDKNNFPHTSDL